MSSKELYPLEMTEKQVGLILCIRTPVLMSLSVHVYRNISYLCLTVVGLHFFSTL